MTLKQKYINLEKTNPVFAHCVLIENEDLKIDWANTLKNDELLHTTAYVLDITKTTLQNWRDEVTTPKHPLRSLVLRYLIDKKHDVYLK